MDKIVWSVGQKVREIRLRKNLSAEQAAYYCDVDPATVSRLERGEGNPTLQTLAKLSIGLNVPFQEFFKFDRPYYETDTEEAMIDEIMKLLSRMDARQQQDVLSIIRLLADWQENAQKHGKKEG